MIYLLILIFLKLQLQYIWLYVKILLFIWFGIKSTVSLAFKAVSSGES